MEFPFLAVASHHWADLFHRIAVMKVKVWEEKQYSPLELTEGEAADKYMPLINEISDKDQRPNCSIC